MEHILESNFTDRIVKSVRDVEKHKLTFDELFSIEPKTNDLLNNSEYNLPDWRLLRSHLYNEGRLSLDAAEHIIKRATEIFKKEDNVLYYKPPIILVGDLHGQFYDLLTILDKIGDPETSSYLFMGDFVDRGAFGIEIIFLLYSLKICYPDRIFLIRGNHECRLLTSHFSFKREVIKKYKSEDLYDCIMESFDALPLSLLIETKNSRFLCLHGGLSPDLPTIESIQQIDRFKEPGKSGPLCDILWSDPLEEETAEGLSEDEMQEWYDVDYVENPNRGCGYVFGFTAIQRFLNDNHLTSLIRAHEVQRTGYHLHHFNIKNAENPFVVTVFSAPNYCDFYQNTAAVMKVLYDEVNETAQIDFIQYEYTEHPFWLPNLQDGIEYTFSFLVEKISEICKYLISDKDLGEETEEEKEFYDSLIEELNKVKSGNKSDMIITTPRKSNVKKTVSTVQYPKEFLTIKDRIKMLEETVKESSNKKLVRTPSGVRHSLIELKILRARRRDYLERANTPFDKARRVDESNERIPEI